MGNERQRRERRKKLYLVLGASAAVVVANKMVNNKILDTEYDGECPGEVKVFGLKTGPKVPCGDEDGDFGYAEDMLEGKALDFNDPDTYEMLGDLAIIAASYAIVYGLFSLWNGRSSSQLQPVGQPA